MSETSIPRTEIVFIESNVADYQSMLNSITQGAEVHVLDASQDGLAQMAGILVGRNGIDAIHIVSHGSTGSLRLGNIELNATNLQIRAADVAQIGRALSDTGDILLYGCEVAAGEGGVQFVGQLAQFTGADVAASADLTGAVAKGGNWVLESASGRIETAALQFVDFEGILPSVAGTISSSGQTNFIDFGTVFTDGEGGSSDISGIEYDIYFANSSHTLVNTVQAFNSTINVITYAGLIDSQSQIDGTTTAAELIIKSSGGENFKLTSFLIQDNDGLNGNWVATAYENGSAVGTQNFTINQSGEYVKTVTLSSVFQNVDEVRISVTGGAAVSGHVYGTLFNDFVIANPIVPDTTPPTVGIVVADNSLLAGETSLVTITFSEAVQNFSNADLTIANGSLSAVSSSDGGVTWAATLTPTASVTDSTNLITVNMTTLEDLAGNAGVGTTNSNNYAVETVRPTASIVVADNSLTAGETSLVTFTFSELVTGFTNADLTIANGSLSAVSSSDGGLTWTATLTPTAGITDATNLITVVNTGVTNAAGNAGSGTTNSNNYAVQTVRPTVGVVIADSSLTIGETSLATFTFSEAVTGFSNADLTIANGSLSAVSSSDGGLTWTATLTPTAVITDATNLITVANTGVTNAAGNAGSGTTDSNNYQIDAQRPTASIVVADTSLTIGETSLVTFTFSETVTGFTNADLTIANGSLSLVSSKDNITYRATLTPTANVTDASNLVTLDNTGVQDTAGNAGSGSTDSNNYAVDTSLTSITSATYNATTGALVVTGAKFEAKTGATNDITANKLTLTGEGGAQWTLTDTADVEIDSATQFTLSLSSTDKAAVNLFMNKAGTAATGGSTFNLAAADDFVANITANDTSDATNAVTVSNVPSSTITTATYNAATGVLVVTGTGLNRLSGATNDIDATKLTLTGEGGATFTLTADTSNVEVTNGTSFTITLGSNDRAAVNQFMNKNGTTATDGTTTFNLGGATGWNPGSSLGAADATSNTVTVSNVAVPTITSATYDYFNAPGLLVVAGTGLLSKSSSANDIDVSKLSILAEGSTVTLSTSSNVDITSGTSFTVTLSATDKAALALLTNQAGTKSTDGIKYNVAAAEDWALGADTGVNVADLTNNGLTVSNIPRPTITSTVWTQNTGVLAITGTNFVTKFGAANDVNVTKLTLIGDSTAYTLTGDTVNVEITSATSILITVGAIDKAAIATRLNKEGTSSTGSFTYNLAAAEDWLAGTTGANINLVDADLTGNGITVGGFNVAPVITSNGGGATAILSMAENSTTVTTVTATDADADTDTPTFTITGGADQAKFVVNAKSGALSFATAPDFEAPASTKINNTYVVDVTASDGKGGTDVQTLTVTVTDVDESAPPAPVPTPTPTPATGTNGIAATIEDAVPGLITPTGQAAAVGDGNGDGIKDSTQVQVASLSFLQTPTVSTPGTAASTFVSLVVGSQDGKVTATSNTNASLANVVQKDAPVNLPADLKMPLGLIAFTATVGLSTPGTLAVGVSETFSLYVDPTLGVNGYWKQNTAGTWVNLASEAYGGKIVSEGGKTRLDFTLTDGGQFDADGKIDGVITDPGALASMPLSLVGYAPTLADGTHFWF